MNIFVLDEDPTLAAQAQCDKHIVKMTLETAQILSTAAWKRGHRVRYGPTHANHPCVVWAGSSAGNWLWLVVHGLSLSAEYTKRYGRQHASHSVIDELALCMPHSPANMTDFVQAVPERFKRDDAVSAYRAYYLEEKAKFATWKSPSRPPSWWTIVQK